MSDQQTITLPEFQGSSEQQQLARQAYEAMMAYGAFHSREAPIRQLVSHLADYLAATTSQDAEALRPKLDAAISANPQVFKREAHEDDVLVMTSRAGRYVEPRPDHDHNFAQRLYEPEHPLPVDDLSVVITTVRPALTTVEPVYISDYWRAQASGGVLPSSSAPEAVEVDDDAPLAPAAEAALPPAEAEDVPAELPVAASAAEAPAAPSSPLLTINDQLTIDLRRAPAELLAEHGSALLDAMRHALEHDPLRRIVSFGQLYFAEEQVETFSKGDFRRIREYVQEQGEPVLDTAIMSDLYGRSARGNDMFRFALNYRLNREKDFEFVGTQGAQLWSVKGLPTIGTKRLKASEIGQLYSYLEEGFDDSLEAASAEAIAESRQASRFLTFFEWEYGVLPLDGALKALLPTPLLADQRSVVLRVDMPQHYTSALVELRVATGNRGGWLQGFEELFHEYLVPGALVTLARGEEPNVLLLQYEATAGEEARMLTLDEKKGRYAFNPVEFYCAVDADLAPSQERLPRLRNMKLLTPGDRKRLESTLAHVFEQVGQSQGESYTLPLEDLFLAANVQRPASRSLIVDVLGGDQRFSEGGAGYLFTPVRDEEEEEEADDDEE